MTTYQPAERIAEFYTDEVLRAEAFFGGEVAELLLTLPAEYRQPCEVETNRRLHRAYPTQFGEERYVPTDVRMAVRHAVAADILRQLAEERAG